MQRLIELDLMSGVDCIGENMVRCYKELVALELIGEAEIPLLRAWLRDIDRGVGGCL